jgi:hypothetical protein
MTGVGHLTIDELQAGLNEILRSPKEAGILQLIVRRPRVDERELLEEAQLHPVEGLVGDNWRVRGSSQTEDGSAHPEMQLTIMNVRVIALLAQVRDRWPLAGDQLFIDMDLSSVNLPSGTRLALGSAVIVVTDQPHTGCSKFAARFGRDALKFISSPAGRKLNMRGVNAKVVEGGAIRIGDVAKKI